MTSQVLSRSYVLRRESFVSSVGWVEALAKTHHTTADTMLYPSYALAGFSLTMLGFIAFSPS